VRERLRGPRGNQGRTVPADCVCPLVAWLPIRAKYMGTYLHKDTLSVVLTVLGAVSRIDAKQEGGRSIQNVYPGQTGLTWNFRALVASRL
jgi:hypothetical protein